MRNFLLFFPGHYASTQVALEKFKTPAPCPFSILHSPLSIIRYPSFCSPWLNRAQEMFASRAESGFISLPMMIPKM
jgi:hypothetical protein